jgi:hypothetical protein
VVRLRVVAAGEQVDRAGTRRRQADAEAAAVLGLRARGERGGLLVADLDELEPVLLPDARRDGVDPVAGVAEDPPDAPLVAQPLDE